MPSCGTFQSRNIEPIRGAGFRVISSMRTVSGGMGREWLRKQGRLDRGVERILLESLDSQPDLPLMTRKARQARRREGRFTAVVLSLIEPQPDPPRTPRHCMKLIQLNCSQGSAVLVWRFLDPKRRTHVWCSLFVGYIMHCFGTPSRKISTLRPGRPHSTR